MKGGYCLLVAVLLFGCAAAQLLFSADDFPPRADTSPFDNTPPCGGHPLGQYTLANDSAVNICYTVGGNHGNPNIVNFNVGPDVDPLTQADFQYVNSQKITDGELATNCFNYNMTDGTVKTFQLNYTTGDSFYVYCLDIQYGELPPVKDAANALAYSLYFIFAVVLALVL